jgi:hypothetical protein
MKRKAKQRDREPWFYTDFLLAEAFQIACRSEGLLPLITDDIMRYWCQFCGRYHEPTAKLYPAHLMLTVERGLPVITPDPMKWQLDTNAIG